MKDLISWSIKYGFTTITQHFIRTNITLYLLNMNRIPNHRPPTHAGKILLEEFLIPLGLTQQELAEAIHVPYS